jgi:hypothetical protein
MAIQVQRDMTIVVSNDTSQTQVLHKRRAVQTDATSTDYEIDATRQIAAGATVQLEQGGMTTIKAVMLEADGALQFRKTQAGDTFAFQPHASGQKSLVWLETSLTALWITNPSSTAAVTLTYILAGT